MQAFSIDLDTVESLFLRVFDLRYFKVILFVQLIVVVFAIAIFCISIDMVADYELFALLHKNSWNAASLSQILPCGDMKQACPCFRQLLVDNHIIFNFEFIAPIRDGPDMVTFCQGYIAIDGEDVF